MQTRHEDKYQLADDIKKDFKEEIEVDSWGGPLNILEFSPKGINKAYALNYLLKAMRKSTDDLMLLETNTTTQRCWNLLKLVMP